MDGDKMTIQGVEIYCKQCGKKTVWHTIQIHEPGRPSFYRLQCGKCGNGDYDGYVMGADTVRARKTSPRAKG